MPEPNAQRLIVDANLETPEILALGSGLVAVVTLRCPGREAANEDSVAVIPVEGGGGVLAVADGFGGRPQGEKASRAALQALRKHVQEAHRKHLPARGAILDGFEAANTAVMDLGVGAATTLVAADVVKGRLHTYNVGDSQLIVVGQRGKLKLRTIPHSPVGYAIEAGILDEKEAMHHEDRHYVSNMVGSPEMRIELTVAMQLDPLDTVVIGSDGLWDNMAVDEVVEIVRAGPMDQALVQLLDQVKTRMTMPTQGRPSKLDDCTVVLYRLQPAE